MKVPAIGLVTGAAMIFINLTGGSMFQFLFPSIKAAYANTHLFRPMRSLMIVNPFIEGVLLVWLWTKVRDLFTGETLTTKGWYFGLFYWVLSVPGMLISYSTFPISVVLIVSWTTGILAESLCAGWLFSKLLKQPL